mgnify:CR=1 FL=1|tara:strand:+ start:2739 stop:3920 length:1182 start_codon:yes stop_codon:yes gene_type:complete
MANTPLTPTAVTREILRVAHERIAFIGTVDRQYDSSFAKTGAKIGDTLKIRLPNEYTVRTGKTLNAQDTAESSVSLTVATQKGVDMNFSSQELTMEIDDFSKRIIEPAVAVLVSNIESSMFDSVTKEVYNHVGTPGTLPTILEIAQAKAKLNQNLAPKDDNRCIQMESVDMAGEVNALKGLFHDSKEISKQYRDGVVGRTMGLKWVENERIYTHTVGGDVAVAINDTPAEGDANLTIDAASAAAAVGDIFTIAGVKAVHPETKVAYSHEQQFVISAATTTLLTFTPSLEASGANQNIDHLPSDNDVITIVGTASTAYPNHLAYHKDAFAFATADLEMPQGVHFAAREQYDGLSIRLVRQYDINNDNIPCRLDILHGYKALRPEWACRVMGSGS